MRFAVALLISITCAAAERAPLSKVEAAAEAYIKAVAAAAAAVPDEKQGKANDEQGATPSEVGKLSHWQSLKRKARQMQDGDLRTRVQFATECLDQLYGFYGIDAPVITPPARQPNPR